MEDVPQKAGHHHPTPDPPPKPNATMTVMARKLDHLTEKVTQLEDKLHNDQRSRYEKSSQELCEVSYLRIVFNALKKDHSDLEKRHARLQTEHSKLHQEMADLKLYLQAFQEDNSKVLRDHEKLKSEMTDMKASWQRTQSPDVEKLREEQTDILKQAESMRKEITSLSLDLSNTKDTDIAQLRSELQDLSQLKRTNDPGDLREEMAKLQEEYSKLISHQNDLETKVQNLQTGLCTDMDTDIAQLRSDLQNLNQLNQTYNPGDLREKMAKLQEDYGKLMAHQNDLETKVQNLQTELHTDMDTIRTVQSNLHGDLSKLQSENVDPVLAEHLQLQQKQTTLTSDVDTLRTQIADMQASLRQSLEKVTSSFNDIESRLGRARPLFQLSGLKINRTRQDQAMTFREVTLNDGAHYDDASGIFTAPVAGLYYFTAAVTSRTKDTVFYCTIMVGDDRHCTIQGGESGGSGSVMVRLVQGKKVWLKVENPKAIVSYVLGGSFWPPFCHFSGTLVLPLDFTSR